MFTIIPSLKCWETGHLEITSRWEVRFPLVSKIRHHKWQLVTFLFWLRIHLKGVLQISSDGGDRIGAKIETQKHPWKSVNHPCHLKCGLPPWGIHPLRKSNESSSSLNNQPLLLPSETSSVKFFYVFLTFDCTISISKRNEYINWLYRGNIIIK